MTWRAKLLIGILCILGTIALMLLTSCYAPAPVYETYYPVGGCFVEGDTVVGGDTIYIWNKSK